MCSREWDGIDYGKVPSVAAARYQKAFSTHDEAGYAKYRDMLTTGEAKINASAVYPSDVLYSLNKGDAVVASAQWKALPNYLEGTNERILPVVDVSGSMGSLRYSGASDPITVAIALGLYLSERNEGVFKDVFCTFSANPQFIKTQGTLAQRAAQMSTADWGMNTDLMKTFSTILEVARRDGLTEDQMPTKVLVLSDMEFDRCTSYSGYGCASVEKTNFEAIDAAYEQAGYKRPQLIFWNLNGRSGNSPVSAGEAGTALVSGFSPAIMKSLLGGEDFTPESIMLKTVMVDKYTF
jgi:hypothetical protein